MKKNIHPSLHKIKVVNGKGEVIETYSTNPKDAILSISHDTHQAWNKKDIIVDLESGISKRLDEWY